MNRYKKLFSDTLILAIGTFGSKLLVFLLMPLYTAWLSPSEYSAAELITGTANLIIPFACIGITNGIFRFVADRDADKEKIFSTGLVLLGAGFAVTLAVGLPFCFAGTLRTEAALIICYVLSADLQAVCAQYVRAVDKTRLFAFQGILNTLTTVLCNVLLLKVFDLGMMGYVLSVIVGNLITTAFLVLAAKLWRSVDFSKVDRATAWELMRFSLPMVPTTICWLITDLSDRYFVNAICGAAVNGIYSAAYKIPTVVTLVSGIFMQAWQFSAVTQSAEEEECRSFYSQVFRVYLSLIFFGTTLLILLSAPLCEILLSDAYGEAKRFMPTLLVSAALEAIVSFLATVYLIRKKSSHSFFTAIAGTLLNLALNQLLIPRIGALGAAVATLASYGVVFLLRIYDAPKLLPFKTYPIRQGVGIALMLAIAAVITAQPTGAIFIGVAITVTVSVLNLPILLSGVRVLLNSRRKR